MSCELFMSRLTSDSRRRTCGAATLFSDRVIMTRLRWAGALGRAIEHKLGFHAQVLLGTTAELRDVVARSPFAGRNATNAANSSSLSCLTYPMPKPRACCTALILILRRYTFLAASCSWHGTFEIDARTGKDPQKVRNRQKFQHCDEAAGNGRKAGDRAKVTGGNG